MWSPARIRMMSPASCSITLKFWSTASAVPRYHSATRPRAMYGWRSLTPPLLRSRSQGRPSPMWSLSDRGLYWVSTTTLSIPELTQFDSVKSMIRYLPPNGTAGLARTDDRIDSRSPSPPARMTAITGFTNGRPSRACGRRGAGRAGVHADCRACDGGALGELRSAGALGEQARVPEVAVVLDHPVQVRPRRVPGVALVADDLALRHDLARVDRVARLEVGVPGGQVR